MDNIGNMDNIRPQKSLAVKEMAEHYRNSISAVGGKRELFTRNRQTGKPLGTEPKKWYKDRYIILVSIIAAAISVYLMSLAINAHNIFSYLTYPFLAFSLWCHVRNVKTWTRIENKRHIEQYELALYFEPEALWNIEYPTKGEKGELITAVLSARKYLGILASATTMPIDLPSSDPQFVHIIKSIMESKEDEINGYIYDQINFLCESTKSYLAFYSPLISLDLEMKQASQVKK
jgi:hypothetical protein